MVPALALQHRVEKLEVEARRWRLMAGVCAIGLALVVLAAFSAQKPALLRVRGIVVVDSAGRERIFLGAPVPDPREGKRISPSIGLTINDSIGNERFGFGLQQNGRFVMGFDAPPAHGRRSQS